MKWNWQLENWPNFSWDPDKLVVFEQSFTESVGIIIGSSQHISQESKQNLFINLLITAQTFLYAKNKFMVWWCP